MSSVPPLTTDDPPAVACVGLIAGWGDYPLVVARKLKLLGYRVICVGIREHADAELAELCDAYTTVNPARGGKGIRFFERHNVKHVMMAGKVQKLILFRKLAWLRLIPDLTTLKMFYNQNTLLEQCSHHIQPNQLKTDGCQAFFVYVLVRLC